MYFHAQVEVSPEHVSSLQYNYDGNASVLQHGQYFSVDWRLSSGLSFRPVLWCDHTGSPSIINSVMFF